MVEFFPTQVDLCSGYISVFIADYMLILLCHTVNIIVDTWYVRHVAYWPTGRPTQEIAIESRVRHHQDPRENED